MKQGHVVGERDVDDTHNADLIEMIVTGQDPRKSSVSGSAKKHATTNDMKRRVSLSDVAAAAKVSIGTVSNVLNTPERVRACDAGDRVYQAMRDLGYRQAGFVFPAEQDGLRIVDPPPADPKMPLLVSVGYISVDLIARIGVMPHRRRPDYRRTDNETAGWPRSERRGRRGRPRPAFRARGRTGHGGSGRTPTVSGRWSSFRVAASAPMRCAARFTNGCPAASFSSRAMASGRRSTNRSTSIGKT